MTKVKKKSIQKESHKKLLKLYKTYFQRINFEVYKFPSKGVFCSTVLSHHILRDHYTIY